MEYGSIVNRSVNIVWQNKFLIVLGFLASLGSGSLGNGGGGGDGNGSAQPFGEPGQFPQFGEPGQFPEFGQAFAGLAIGVIIAVLCVVIVVGIALWVVSTIARGGLIASVDRIEFGEKSSFSQAWRAGWNEAWTLLGIGLLPGIPGLILFVLGVLALGAYGGIFALFGEQFAPPAGMAGLGIIGVLAACVIVPIVLVLSILRSFAERACMLEDLGVIDAYRRGWNVLTAHLGEAVILFLLQIVVFIALGVLLFLPGLFLLICCFLWPLLMAVQGAISAVVSAMWTLAWRTWTGEPPKAEKTPAAV
jgi:hypothetical protein